MADDQKKTWALVELFGHNRVAGEIMEAEMGGGSLIRIDIPGNGTRDPLTKLYNVKAIYGITFVDEATARTMADNIETAPVSAYSLENAVRMRMKQLQSGEEVEREVAMDIPF